jgi:hypothetical protein
MDLDGGDLEFCWCNDNVNDPALQEKILSSYTANGILTINEARAALGREPFSEDSANRPMIRSAAGYVALPD